MTQLKQSKHETEVEFSKQLVNSECSLVKVQEKYSTNQQKLNSYIKEIRNLQEELENTKALESESLEEIERLKNSLTAGQKAHLTTQKELLATKSSLTTNQQLCKKLQEDCDAMASQLTSWSRENRYGMAYYNTYVVQWRRSRGRKLLYSSESLTSFSSP